MERNTRQDPYGLKRPRSQNGIASLDNNLARFVLGFAIIFAFAALGQFVVWQYQRQSELQEAAMLSDQLLRRVELSADYAVIALGDLLENEHYACSGDQEVEFGDFIKSKGAVKDVAIIDNKGNVQCSGAGNIGRPSVATFIPSPWYPARNPDMFLSAGPKESGNVFALLWRVTPEQRFLIVLNVDTLLFDVFPSKWRDNAEAAIRIGTEEAVARRNPTMLAGYQAKSFEARSDRYPLEVHLEIADSLFPTWRSYRAAPGALLGAAFGVMVFAISLLMINRRYGPALSLQRAIRHGEIQPFFQPVFKLSSGEIIGCEVLVRWTKNGKGRHTPDSFIPQAEADGTIVALTDYLLSDALGKLSAVLTARPDFTIAFNIAPHHFQQDWFVDQLVEHLAPNGVRARQVILELTERQAFVEPHLARKAVLRAQAAGFLVALDDTGVGQNGLANVQELGSDPIKIDKKFVDLVGIDDTATAIVTMLVGLARRLGASTIAEGIESERQVLALLRCGVDQGQGYLVGRPVPVEEFLGQLHANVQTHAGANSRAIAINQ
ncbi:EAL domain-containing protein [Rhizobium sp. BK376]|uniref:EAL domain-containing protein n=1 Tax=Rhizobium sp. BK376 TaxID=2512149 RepID=UPI00104E724E|nr:EAL domain-containing protein [Rhizobium sp. BK376]TCR79610.1 sensor c-di-GMP phosphodiesterase-like protein [Rhizobium sp. BK376]